MFNVINLDVRQSRLANDSASIVKLVKERLRNFLGNFLKISLMYTLVHRALMICTKRGLNGEIERVKKILLDNRYPNKRHQRSDHQENRSVLYPLAIRYRKVLDVLEGFLDGKPSINLKREVKTAVDSCYGSVNTRLVFTSNRMLPVARKDVLPTIQKSFAICKYKCHCDSRYVGRTSQRLQDCIKQHVPQWLRHQLTPPRRSQPHTSCKRNDTKPDCDSAIGKHLQDNDQCALNNDNKRFSILATARSYFDLNLLEAVYIKTQRPALCRQKGFV